MKAHLPPFEEIEHTADLRLRVFGCNLPELFANAALGMFSLMQCRPTAHSSPISHHVLIESGDVTTLLVDWLNEILYLSERDQACLSEFEIIHLEAYDEKPSHLEATARGKSHCLPKKGIKAVTFHALEFTRQEGGAYQVTITFDV